MGTFLKSDWILSLCSPVKLEESLLVYLSIVVQVWATWSEAKPSPIDYANYKVRDLPHGFLLVCLSTTVNLLAFHKVTSAVCTFMPLLSMHEEPRISS